LWRPTPWRLRFSLDGDGRFGALLSAGNDVAGGVCGDGCCGALLSAGNDVAGGVCGDDRCGALLSIGNDVGVDDGCNGWAKTVARKVKSIENKKGRIV